MFVVRRHVMFLSREETAMQSVMHTQVHQDHSQAMLYVDSVINDK